MRGGAVAIQQLYTIYEVPSITDRVKSWAEFVSNAKTLLIAAGSVAVMGFFGYLAYSRGGSKP